MITPFALAIGTFLITYALILTERINRALLALAGAGILILGDVLSQEEAIHAIDFNTLGLLLGMMVIVTITKETGLFQYLALHAAQKVKGKPMGLMLMMALVTAVCSALLDNVTTVLLVTPVILSLTDKLKVSPWPFLVSTIFASNIGGTATLVGDPPNIMIGSAVGLSFNDFLVHLAPLSVVVMLATFVPMAFIWRKQLVTTDALRASIMKEKPRKSLTNRTLLINCLLTLLVVLIGFLTHGITGLEPASVALAGAVLLLLLETYNHDSEKQHHKVQTAVAEAEWVTLLFFVGLFVLVHGLVKVGAISMMAEYMISLTHGDMKLTATYLLWGSAVFSAIVDNIPYVATMIPLLQEMAPSFGGKEAMMPLWWSLAAGACLGGNGSLIGASANLVVAGLAAKQGVHIKFGKFLLVAFPFMLLSIAITHVYIMVRYF
ncbi:MAG: hypothetical protein COY40_02845 [Alphaproteobacteria bacterium CG_4_10_14_0_8_um_filter_53_9]|nr:MAG: hypothetical protein COY40_02845 [Alphaproteobacteria bacterium CG_4_10_14_0_8_um_filter_53_9]